MRIHTKITIQNYTIKMFVFEIYDILCTMGRICIESEFQYALSKQIYKCLKFRTLVISIMFYSNLLVRKNLVIK